mmetsp:Transcript_5904/g.7967  ORF Transcript_5904/g.7967 Transcript_5904/m.7967 type:complete len:203 (+) Transcript_5904:503-1111(+)|eukprot:CAMPEP_0196583744 /NCGR_PEP_ID=MMETSP1081-20130531/44501_1 /TAXON_ID=36882 /ORGANISM="Pyramimonas amylifera, Strain CCMP720" /LENGTH=202 /DNA_ID=CAMNT_0041904715 /DNA_START=486 /DNA_END=1094 /DNA_ORIENTATION=+
MTKVDLKIVLLGQQNVGKSCLVDRFLNYKYEEQQKNTIGAAFGAKRVFLPSGKGMTLGIWDTAGAERFESLSRVYYHSAGAALVCFDPMNRESWVRLAFWTKELMNNEPNCKIYITETKLDMVSGPRRVSEEEVQAYSNCISAQVHQTSAKTGYNVEELFMRMAMDAEKDLQDSFPFKSSDTISLESRNKDQSILDGFKCCN